MERYLPYGRQIIDDEDIAAVVAVLHSDWLTTGPALAAFEKDICDFVGAAAGIGVSSGTAALHCAVFAAGIGPGDEVIVPPLTFAATANAVLYQGGIPVFADVEPGTLLLNPEAAERAITPRTKAVIPVDYAGQPCDYDALRQICIRHGLVLIADSCHALGAESGGIRCGSLADITVFSFHPVKHITTGEGGMVVTDNENFAARARLFRNHGIDLSANERERKVTWEYRMTELGNNYRLTDLHAALGRTQLQKLPGWLQRRQEIAETYDALFADTPQIRPLEKRTNLKHAYHLYVVSVGEGDEPEEIRRATFLHMRSHGIGVNVHYLPVHLHPYYQRVLGTRPGLCPVAEQAYHSILSLPMFPGLTDADLNRICETLSAAL